MTSPSSPAPGPLLRETGFRRLFLAAAVSTVGTQISAVALPLVAVTVLAAGAVQVGLLGVARTVAFLVVGLPAGVWLARLPRRRVMVTADLARAALLGSVPVAWALGALTLAQLYAVTLVAGVATVFFDVAAQSYLPSLVGRARLVPANAALTGWDAGAGVAGPGLAGGLVQLTSAPLAVGVDAVTYLWSAASLARLPEAPDAVPPGAGDARRGRLVSEIAAGVRFVAAHPVLRPVALVGLVTNLFVQMTAVPLPLLFARGAGPGAAALGLFLAAGGAGLLVGSLAAHGLAARFGTTRALVAVGALTTPFGFALPLAGTAPGRWAAAVAWAALMARIGMNNVVLVSLRQQVTPDAMLTRMNATMRFLLTGVLAVGSAIAGVIAEVAGVRVCLAVSAVGLALAWLPVAALPRPAVAAAER